MVHYLRESGILLHPSCLPSPFAIGDLGPGAYEFLKKCTKQTAFMADSASESHRIW